MHWRDLRWHNLRRLIRHRELRPKYPRKARLAFEFLGLSMLGAWTSCASDSNVAEDGVVDVADITDATGIGVPCTPQSWSTEESGCMADMICLGEDGCYPLER